MSDLTRVLGAPATVRASQLFEKRFGQLLRAVTPKWDFVLGLRGGELHPGSKWGFVLVRLRGHSLIPLALSRRLLRPTSTSCVGPSKIPPRGRSLNDITAVAGAGPWNIQLSCRRTLIHITPAAIVTRAVIFIIALSP